MFGPYITAAIAPEREDVEERSHIMFITNMGPIDRTIRILIGVALLALVWTGPQTAWGYIGLLPLVTGAAGYCPLYAWLGLSSCGSFHRMPEHA